MYTDKQKYELAQMLMEIAHGREINEEEMFALEDAAEIISPQFMRDYEDDIESALTDPEAAAFAEAMKRGEGDKFLAEHLQKGGQT